MERVVYEGPTKKDDLSTEFHIRDEDGKMVRLAKGEVSDELADSLRSELLDGSDRTKGHKFRELTDDEAKSYEQDSKPSSRTARAEVGSGGSGGSTPAPGATGSPTGTTPTA